jgi:hypothetical protein
MVAARLNCSHREAASVLRALADLVSTDLATQDNDEQDVAA